MALTSAPSFKDFVDLCAKAYRSAVFSALQLFYQHVRSREPQPGPWTLAAVCRSRFSNIARPGRWSCLWTHSSPVLATSRSPWPSTTMSFECMDSSSAINSYAAPLGETCGQHRIYNPRAGHWGDHVPLRCAQSEESGAQYLVML